MHIRNVTTAHQMPQFPSAGIQLLKAMIASPQATPKRFVQIVLKIPFQPCEPVEKYVVHPAKPAQPIRPIKDAKATQMPQKIAAEILSISNARNRSLLSFFFTVFPHSRSM